MKTDDQQPAMLSPLVINPSTALWASYNLQTLGKPGSLGLILCYSSVSLSAIINELDSSLSNSTVQYEVDLVILLTSPILSV